MNPDPELAIQNLGSFRDPAGAIYETKEQVFRVLTMDGTARLRRSFEAGLLQKLISDGKLVPFSHVSGITHLPLPKGGTVLEHPKLPFISYPYEWSFHHLRTAALFHLQLQLTALEFGIALADASAFNIQFVSGEPLFIDHLSFVPYTDGDLWWGYDQFLRQFVNPLIIAAYTRTDWRALLAMNWGGVTSPSTRRLLPAWRRFRPAIFRHVSMPAILQGAAESLDEPETNRSLRISRRAYEKQLHGIHDLISALRLRSDASDWSAYQHTRTYSDGEVQQKQDFVRAYCRTRRPMLLVDLGCNTGEFARVALESGAADVVGVDSDAASIELCSRAASRERLRFLPLALDVLNPTPGLGWNNLERTSFCERCIGKSVLALALVHHLAITGQVPLPAIVEWITTTFRDGVIEFIPLDDPAARTLSRNARHIPIAYSRGEFEQSLSSRSEIIREEVISNSGRVLYHFRSGR